MNDVLPAGETHRVENIGTELVNYNLYASDAALVDAVSREGGAWGHADLVRFGADIGRAEYLEHGYLANRYSPELETHDRFGRRIDYVRYHPSYHALMKTAFREGIHSSAWAQPGPGAHVVRGAKDFMHGQVESGHQCPTTMTFSSIPCLRSQPDLATHFESKILACDYDPRNLPIEQKSALTVGMGMTEKQGGSDVRLNTTRAEALSERGGGCLYRLTGHKWFLSAPMCDLFMVLAQAPGGLSCFLVPRWLPGGEKNPLQVIRLKDKMGNRSNASSEVELRGAQGWLIGEEGRGVATIIEMVGVTRFNCMGASAGLMRVGVANALHYCRQRRAFGRPLAEQPLMQNVLADLALEYEAAIAMSMRMARALDNKDVHDSEASLARLMTAVGKFWVCKRTPQHSYEVMECIGGSGVMENALFPRVYREAVINPIWEGSGNVQCLDVLRTMAREPQAVEAFMQEINPARGQHPVFDTAFSALSRKLAALPRQQRDDADTVQFGARRLTEQMALVFQASLLLQHAPESVASAWCESRLVAEGGFHYGSLRNSGAVRELLERADPTIAKAPAAGVQPTRPTRENG